jgi:hypothetical protein
VNGVDPNLLPHLAAWRNDSLQDPRAVPRERARAALHVAVASAATRRTHGVRLPSLPWFRSLRLRHRRPVLAAAAAAVAATVIGALGWNAPVGSALYAVRAAKQSVQLAIPGTDLAALHMQFAEQDLADARAGASAAALTDARAELAAARGVLPSDRGSPLWVRYDTDEATLATESAGLDNPTPSPRSGSTRPGSGDDRSGDGPTAAPGGAVPAQGSAEPGDSGAGSPAPSGRGDDGHSAQPGATPRDH